MTYDEFKVHLLLLGWKSSRERFFTNAVLSISVYPKRYFTAGDIQRIFIVKDSVVINDLTDLDLTIKYIIKETDSDT